MYICIADNFQALVQYSDAIAAQTGKAVCCPLLSTFLSFVHFTFKFIS